MKYQIRCDTIVGIGFGTLAVIYFVYRIRKKRQQDLPKNPEWQLVGTVKELSIYPLRSGAALLVNAAECNKFGLRIQGITDRVLVLLNEQGKLAFAGTYPSMLSITSEIEDESTVVLVAPNRNPLRLNINRLTQGKSVIEKQCKGFRMQLIECGKEHHKWFSELILMRPEGLCLYIALEPKLEYNLWGEDKSEFNPIMIMNNKSVEDLNVRLKDRVEVHHLQFRGNILFECVKNVRAYDEDRWVWLKIGDTSDTSCILQYRAPCLRCILPNIDIRTCERNTHFEPLKTLKKYRLIHDTKEPTMGAYFKVHKEGILQVNDPVYALRDCRNKSIIQWCNCFCAQILNMTTLVSFPCGPYIGT